MTRQGHGTIAVITSVAGDRGRQSNFVYGAAKAMVSTYLQGLRGRLLASGIHVVDIRPGFVDSPMTAAFKKGPLWSSPERVADIMVSAIRHKRHTVYAPHYWRIIMFAVRLLPEFLFKRIRL
jgi:short-subunit dehydrogenase